MHTVNLTPTPIPDPATDPRFRGLVVRALARLDRDRRITHRWDEVVHPSSVPTLFTHRVMPPWTCSYHVARSNVMRH